MEYLDWASCYNIKPLTDDCLLMAFINPDSSVGASAGGYASSFLLALPSQCVLRAHIQNASLHKMRSDSHHKMKRRTLWLKLRMNCNRGTGKIIIDVAWVEGK